MDLERKIGVLFQVFCIFVYRFGCRSDAGCVYWLRVRLLNSDMDEIDKKEIREEKDKSGDWFQVNISV